MLGWASKFYSVQIYFKEELESQWICEMPLLSNEYNK